MTTEFERECGARGRRPARGRKQRHKRASRRMTLEQLEQRLTPTAFATLTLNADDSVSFLGSSGVSDNVTVPYDSPTQTYTISDTSETITITDNSGGGLGSSGSGMNTVSVSPG